jgi:hypothetical protein
MLWPSLWPSLEVSIQTLDISARLIPCNLYRLRVWEGWFPKGKTRVLLPEKETDAGQKKNNHCPH